MMIKKKCLVIMNKCWCMTPGDKSRDPPLWSTLMHWTRWPLTSSSGRPVYDLDAKSEFWSLSMASGDNCYQSVNVRGSVIAFTSRSLVTFSQIKVTRCWLHQSSTWRPCHAIYLPHNRSYQPWHCIWPTAECLPSHTPHCHSSPTCSPSPTSPPSPTSSPSPTT